MQVAGRYQAIIEILDAVLTESKPADAIIHAYLKARRYIGSKDRAAIVDPAYNLMRHYYRLGFHIDESGVLPKDGRTLLLAYLLFVEQKKLATIEADFNGEKFSPAPLEKEEIRILRQWLDKKLISPTMPEECQTECPAWAYPKLKDHFGQHYNVEMATLLPAAGMDIRVNRLKATRDDVLKTLLEKGLPATPSPFAHDGIRIARRVAFGDMDLLKDGLIEIQDEGSQLVALLTGAKAGMRVMDFCAGAGGKSLAMAALMENKGRIIASDILFGRLKRAAVRFARAGVHNISLQELSSERDVWIKKHQGTFDRVLVDAPCSGTGTWRRNPDARFKHLGPGLGDLLTVQQDILTSAARLTKKGGWLIYATCSLLPEENTMQIQRFLEKHDEYVLVPYKDVLHQDINKGDMLQLTPYQHGTDGFFGAVLQKKAA
jgi:16S rRNA (cytosine967-C5)-methyltransferase